MPPKKSTISTSRVPPRGPSMEVSPVIRAMEAIFLAFFTHKGGVGKTTSIHNVAAQMAQAGLRVMLVDMDTQASLTGLVMYEQFVKMGTDALLQMPTNERKLYRKSNDIAKLGEHTFLKTIRTVRKTIFELFQSVNTRGHLRWIKDNFEQVVNEVEPVKINQGGQEFLFIPGDRRISKIDNELAEVFGAESSGATYAELLYFKPGLITKLLRSVAKKHAVDVVLIDFGPSPTPLNRSAFLGSDYFVVNNLPDFLSRWSIEALADVIQEWNETAEPLRGDAAGNFRLPPCPKYLGTIISRVKIYNTDIVWDQHEKIKLIMKETENHLHQFKVPSATYLKEPNLIRDFVRLGSKVEETGKPISLITPEDIPDSSKNNIDDEVIRKSAELYLNSFFSATMNLLANISEDHHQQFGNIFRSDVNKIYPQGDLKIDDSKLPEENGIKMKKIKGRNKDISEVLFPEHNRNSLLKDIEDGLRTSEISTNLSTDIYCAFLNASNQDQETLLVKTFAEFKASFDAKKRDLDLFIKDLRKSTSAFFKTLKRKLLEKDPQVYRLCYRISPELEKSSKKSKKTRRGAPNSQSMEEVIEESIGENSEETKKDEKLTLGYLNAYRETRIAAAKFFKFLRREDVVKMYVELAKKSNVMGEQTFCYYASKFNLKKTKIVVPDSLQKELKTYKEFELSLNAEENTIILCETEGFQKQFCKLITPKPRRLPNPVPGLQEGTNRSASRNRNGKRGNARNEDNGSPAPTKKNHK